MKESHSTKWLHIKNRHSGLVISVVGLLIVFSSYIQIDCSYTQVKITQSLQKNENTLFISFVFTLKMGISFFLNYFKAKFTHRFISKLKRSAMKVFFEEYINLKYSSFNKMGAGAVHHSINKRAKALTEFLSSLVICLISDLCYLIFVFEMIRRELNWVAGLKIVGIVVLFIGFFIVAHKKRAVLRTKINDAVERNTSMNLDILMNYDRIRAFDNASAEIEKYSKIMNDQVYYKQIYEATYEILSFTNQLLLLFLICFIFREYNKNKIVHENIMSFILISTKLRDMVYNISKDIDHIVISHYNLCVTNLKRSDYDEQGMGVQMLSFNSSIVLSNLSFCYNNSAILKDVCCEVRKGDKVAVTGPNGSGKSTFIKLMMGLYEYSGSIRIDGIEARDMDRASVRRLISYIPQPVFLLNKSILRNLSDGNPELSDDQLIQQAKKYKYHELFLGVGYDKEVGERGDNLSGGQRQKICFLRAMISNSPIILMDKACASMDSKSEIDIIEAIHKSMGDKTVINIVDNMVNLQFYDKIFHIENNTLLEDGSFKELMRKKGSFYKFYNN